MLFVPPGFTEQEVLSTIEEVVGKLASPFKFGFHDTNDMKQEGRIFALEALQDGKYDAARGTLRVFLMQVVRNKFINMKRDKFERQHPPCSSCPFYNNSHDVCTVFACKDDCDKWQGWKRRNLVKRNLMEGYNPNEVTENFSDHTSNSDSILSDISNKEVIEYIDSRIPINMRADYCRMLSGIKLPKNRRDKVIELVKQLAAEKFGGETDGE